jgi:hypothetical protein
VVKLASSAAIGVGSSALSEVSGGDLTATKLASSVDIDMDSSALSEVSGGMMSVVGMMSGCGVWSRVERCWGWSGDREDLDMQTQQAKILPSPVY